MADKWELLKKANSHQRKANKYFMQIEDIEQKEKLIGFKPMNDDRISSDRFEIKLEPLMEKPYYYEDI